MRALTFLLFKLNTLQTKIVKLWVRRSHGVMTMVCWIYTTAITPRKWRQGSCFVITQCHVVQMQQSENRNSCSVWNLNNKGLYTSVPSPRGTDLSFSRWWRCYKSCGSFPVYLASEVQKRSIAPVPSQKLAPKVSKSRAIPPYVPGVNPPGWPLINA